MLNLLAARSGEVFSIPKLVLPFKNCPKITLIRSQKGNLPVLAFVRQQAGSQENLHFSPSKLSQIVHVCKKLFKLAVSAGYMIAAACTSIYVTE